MLAFITWLIAISTQTSLLVGLLVAAALFLIVSLVFVLRYSVLWLQAFMSGADISVLSLIGMGFRQVKPSTIVTAKIMATQAGLSIDRQNGISTADLEAHFLAGGQVQHVVRAIIAAHRAGIDLDFDRAAAIDLAGRDVLDAVRTSVSPKVINCPDPDRSAKTALSAVAKDGVELRVGARVTVRMNLDKLIGGATEETIVARVGQGIVSAIGSSATHMDVMGMPSRISKAVLAAGLDAQTAFEIVSIDIEDLEVGENIGARLEIEQAEADTRTARALAEDRRASAVAREQEMQADVTQNRALVVFAEADVPAALAGAFRAGQLRLERPADAPPPRREDNWLRNERRWAFQSTDSRFRD